MSSFPRSRIPAITPKQWERARDLFREPGEEIEPAQLRGITGMEIEAAWSLLLGIAEEHADLYFVIYHTCAEHSVHQRPYLDGYQPVPWECPECEELVTDPDELQYELRAILRSPIDFD